MIFYLKFLVHFDINMKEFCLNIYFKVFIQNSKINEISSTYRRMENLWLKWRVVFFLWENLWLTPFVYVKIIREQKNFWSKMLGQIPLTALYKKVILTYSFYLLLFICSLPRGLISNYLVLHILSRLSYYEGGCVYLLWTNMHCSDKLGCFPI